MLAPSDATARRCFFPAMPGEARAPCRPVSPHAASRCCATTRPCWPARRCGRTACRSGSASSAAPIRCWRPTIRGWPCCRSAASRRPAGTLSGAGRGRAVGRVGRIGRGALDRFPAIRPECPHEPAAAAPARGVGAADSRRLLPVGDARSAQPRHAGRVDRGHRVFRPAADLARRGRGPARRCLPVSDRRALGNLANCLRGEPACACDWTEVLRLANDHLLTPALYDAVDAAVLPADVRDYLTTLHRLNGERNRALRRQAIELIAGLNRQHITPALLKGGLCLFDGPYEDPAARMMLDLDILVPRVTCDEAIDVLHAHGYRLAQGYGSDHHAFGDFARPGDAGSVDLHIELVDPAHLLPAAQVWHRGTCRTSDGIRYVAPSGTDRVLHNLLHAQLHHLGNFYRGTLQL